MGKSLEGDLSSDHVRLGVALFIGYTLFSCLRKPLSSTFPLIKEEFLLSSSEYGVLLSNYALFFGISKLLGGVLSDLIPPKVLFLSSIVIGSVACMGISFCSSFELIGLCWVANGLAQGLCWPACVKLVTTCFPVRVMGTMWSILSCVSLYVTNRRVFVVYVTTRHL
jgi:sugar phosphate permease